MEELSNLICCGKCRVIRILLCRFFCRRSGRKRKEFHSNIDEFDDVEFLEPLSEGGSGTVFRGRTLNNTNRIVAVKQIVIRGVEEGVPGFIIREASLLKELNHHNIVR